MPKLLEGQQTTGTRENADVPASGTALPMMTPRPGTAAPGTEAKVSFVSEEQASLIEADVKRKAAERMARVNALSATLSAEALRRYGARLAIEQRWLEDLQQYNGQYDQTTLANITAAEGSKVFINITRPKVKTAAARLADMLFPTDDRNWDLTPTPVPELSRMLKSDKPLQGPDGQTLMGEPDKNGEQQPLTEADRAMNIMRKAREAASAMALEIDDQLTEAQYPSKNRRLINDACLYGTGVMKGPILRGRTRRSWKKVTGPKGQTVRVLEQVEDLRPGAEHVDVWNFFPDMDVARIEESERNFERMYFTRSQLLDLARQPYYFKDAVVAAVKLGAKASRLTPYTASDKRNASADNAGTTGTVGESTSVIGSGDPGLYEAWEFHGPLEAEDLRALGVEVEEDAEEVLMACVVFVGNIVIKAYVNPLETGAQPYKVFCFERDESCIFGFGVPYRMRHSQRMLNAAVRALMDNAGLSIGPQIIVNKRYVQPADGNWRLKGRKVWEMVDPTKSVKDVFHAFEISSHQVELQAIINLSEKFADTETNLPIISQGEQGGATKTSSGMALLNNNANVITRDTVKNYDDGITAPMIRDFYDWNMQNSEREEIKGDYEVDARGSSVLLSKEIQAQNLMTLGGNFASHPIFGAMTKHLALYRKIVNAMHVAADDVVVTDAEYDSYLASKKDEGESDPIIVKEQMRLQAEAEEAERNRQFQKEQKERDHAHRMQEAMLEYQDNLMRYATQERMGLDELKAMLASIQMENQGKRILQMDKLAHEAAKPPAKPPAKPGAAPKGGKK